MYLLKNNSVIFHYFIMINETISKQALPIRKIVIVMVYHFYSKG
jgi:hypothetical protein